MSLTRIDVDEDALDRVMALSNVRTKSEAVNLALRFYVGQRERAALIGRHFERARLRSAVEDAAATHRTEKLSA